MDALERTLIFCMETDTLLWDYLPQPKELGLVKIDDMKTIPINNKVIGVVEKACKEGKNE